MPTYEYACKACGQHVEVVQSFKDDPLTECPNCGGELRKVFGAIGIAFKGSGFYRNDSRPAPSGEAASETAAKDKSESKGDGAKAGKGDSSDAKSGSGSSARDSRPKASKSDSTSAASS